MFCTPWFLSWKACGLFYSIQHNRQRVHHLQDPLLSIRLQFDVVFHQEQKEPPWIVWTSLCENSAMQFVTDIHGSNCAVSIMKITIANSFLHHKYGDADNNNNGCVCVCGAEIDFTIAIHMCIAHTGNRCYQRTRSIIVKHNTISHSFARKSIYCFTLCGTQCVRVCVSQFVFFQCFRQNSAWCTSDVCMNACYIAYARHFRYNEYIF